MSQLIAKLPSHEKLAQPQSWFRRRQVADPGEKVGETNAVVIKPTDIEAKQVLEGKPCARCRFFKHREGQNRISSDRVMGVLLYDLKWNSVVENMDPADLGNCAADAGKITHKFASCPSWAPKDEDSSNLWKRVRAAYAAFRHPDE